MGTRNSRPKKLKCPYYPGKTEDDEGHQWIIYTVEEKIVSDYTGLKLMEVEELDLVEFLVYKRDARIYNLQQTEEGREYLKDAWRIEQTKPDKESLREKHGKQGAQ